MNSQISPKNDSNDILAVDNNLDDKYLHLFTTNWKLNIVQDEISPSLYSRKTIYTFTILCSVFFGGTLMFINLRRLKNKRGQIVVAMFTIFYGIITITIASLLELPSFFSFLIGMLAANPLCNYFWFKYIGKQTKYNTNPIWIPLSIAILIMSFLIYLTILTYNNY